MIVMTIMVALLTCVAQMANAITRKDNVISVLLPQARMVLELPVIVRVLKRVVILIREIVKVLALVATVHPLFATTPVFPARLLALVGS
jgi:hypothetical protein